MMGTKCFKDAIGGQLHELSEHGNMQNFQHLLMLFILCVSGLTVINIRNTQEMYKIDKILIVK